MTGKVTCFFYFFFKDMKVYAAGVSAHEKINILGLVSQLVCSPCKSFD